MRQALKNLSDKQRYQFEATFSGVGYKTYTHGPKGTIFTPTIVFKNVRHDGQIITDHLWFNYTKGFSQLGELDTNDIVQFNGRVSVYHKGHYPYLKTDYKIGYPTKIKLLTTKDNRPVLPLMPDEKNALIGYVMNVNRKFYLNNNRPYSEWHYKIYKKWVATNQSDNHGNRKE